MSGDLDVLWRCLMARGQQKQKCYPSHRDSRDFFRRKPLLTLEEAEYGM